MRFFKKDLITKEQIDYLKRSLKIYVNEKIIDYNGNFIDHVTMEKGMMINNPDKELLDMIKGHLEQWIDPMHMVMESLKNNELTTYDFYKLPSKLKNYMYKVDGSLHEQWINDLTHKVSKEEYDRRIDRLTELIPDYTDEEFEHYVLLGNTFPTSLGKKARDSANRSYKTIKSIIKSNIDKFTTFMTFTFASEVNKTRHLELNEKRLPGEEEVEFEYYDGTDFELAKKLFTRTIQTLAQNIKRKGMSFEYIAVWEVQRNGAYHFHLLCSDIPPEEKYKVPKWLDYNFVEEKENNGDGLKQWNYGKSDIQKIKDKSRITSYVSKYIMKSFYNVNEESYEQYLHKKKFYTSKGLDRALDIYITEGNKEMVIEKIGGLENPFIKEIINPYNQGKIEKKMYSKN